MSKRNKKKIVIGVLCCMIVFMGIGYAALSQVLNIGTTAKVTGSWNIYISSATVKEQSDVNMNGTEIRDNKTTDISLNVSFKKPNDYITYDITVENAGTIDAKLDEITMTPPSNVIDGTEEKMFLMETQNLTKGSVLKAGRTTTFQMTLRFNEKAITLPSANEEFIFGLKLNYVQVDSANVDTGGTGGGTIGSDNSGLKVVNGVLTEIDMDKYQLDSNGYLVVPATNENGDQITTIGMGAFSSNYNVTINDSYTASDGTTKYLAIIHDKDNAEAIKKVINDNATDSNGHKTTNIEFRIEDKKGVYPDDNYYFNYVNIKTGTIDEDASDVLKATKIDLSQMTSLTTIADNAFPFTDIQEVKLPEGITTVGVAAFDGSSLETINFPSALMNIKSNAFNGTQLKNIVLPEGITKINEYSFSNGVLETVTIPSTVTAIDSDAFSGNSNLKITIKRANSDGMTLGSNWAGNATVVYDPS